MASILEQGVQDILYSMKSSLDFYIGGTDVGSTITTGGDDSGFTWINGDTWTAGTGTGVYKNWMKNQQLVGTTNTVLKLECQMVNGMMLAVLRL